MRPVPCLFVVALLVGAGCGAGDGSQPAERAAPTTISQTTGTEPEAVVPSTTTTAAEATGPLPTPIELIRPEPVPVSSPFASIGIDDARVQMRSLVPWRDGFVTVGEVVQPQRLPDELPEEIASQFPPEINELFPDGLPATLAEAYAIIDEAGMREEFENAVASIPGAYDTIFSTGSPERTPVFAWSADGSTWEGLDAELPPAVALFDDVATAGDRLVLVGRDTDEFGIATLSVADTADLVEWNVNVIEPQRPPDLAVDVELEVWEASLVANDLGWMLEASVVADLQGEGPPDPSAQLEPYLQPGDWGPWQVPNHWFAPWDGDVTQTDPGGEGYPTGEQGLLTATNTGFVILADTARYSATGSSWTSLSAFVPPTGVDYWTSFSQPLPDGVAIYLDGRNMAPVMYRVSDDATVWEPLDFPELPSDLGPAQISRTDAYVLDTYNWSGTIEQWLIASPDGERFIANQFSTASPDGYRIAVAAIQAGMLLVGVDDIESEASEWWRHTFAD